MKNYMENPTEEDRQRHTKQDRKCQEKAAALGEQTFTLRAQDRSSPQTIAFWILANIETAPALKLHDALEAAILMRDAKVRKNAD